MSDYIICGECPAEYRPHEIKAYLGDELAATLDQLQRNKRAGKPSFSARILRRSTGVRDRGDKKLRPRLDELDRLRDYDFFCPRGHPVDGNPGEQFGIGVLGASGASKSHYLAAIVREMFDMSSLRPAGVSLREAVYTNPELSRQVVEVYRRNRSLPATPPGELFGPFGYKLLVNSGNGVAPTQRSMLLYDIAGEDLTGITRIVNQAPFVILCRALIVLIDPVKFVPSEFDYGPDDDKARLNAARDVRGGIQVLAETLAEVYGVPHSQELDIPICFALSKADAVEWNGAFDWEGQTAAVLGAEDLHSALQDSSQATREALIQLGGGLVIDEIEDCFNPEVTRFVAASATSTMPVKNAAPDQPEWVEDPEPKGVALSVLQVLDASGLLPRAAAAADV